MLDRILWLDLETTGSSIDNEILEVGIAITNKTFEVIDTRGYLHKPLNSDFSGMDPIVFKMHSQNHLLEDISHGFDLEYIDTQINIWLDSLGFDKKHIPLAGSGVSHFDRQFIRKYLPKFDIRLTYWAYDVGVLRRV